MVNNIGAQNLQAQSVIAAEGIASTELANDFYKTPTETRAMTRVELYEQLVDSGNTQNVTKKLLGDFINKLAQAGIEPTVKTKDQTKTIAKGDEAADRVELGSAALGDLEKMLPVKRSSKSGAQTGQSDAEVETKWEVMKEELIKEGKSSQTISQIEGQFKASEAKKRLMGLLQDSATMYYLDSDNFVSKLVRRRGFAVLLDKAGKELATEAAENAKSELKGFVLQELEHDLIMRTFLQDEKFEYGTKLVKLGDKVGAEAMTWIDKVWPNQKIHAGVNYFDVPPSAVGMIDLKDNDPDAQRRKKEREAFDYNDGDDKDVALNRLRACYMRLALRPDSVTSLKTWFKIQTLKNGLVRLGIYTQDLDEQVKGEGKTLAKVRLMEMLDESLHERASLFDPKRDGIIDGKIKNCLKNLERLGLAVDDNDFIALRDKANQRMYDLVEQEYRATETITGPEAKQRLESLMQLMARLRRESNLSVKEEV